jgi:hypothetical protein
MGEIPYRCYRLARNEEIPHRAIALHGMGEIPYRSYRLALNNTSQRKQKNYALYFCFL